MDSDRGLGVGIIIGVIIAAVLFFGSLVLPFPWSFLTAIKVVISVAFLVVLGIAGWIGWTMASTPTPEDIGDIEDLEDFDEFEEPEEITEPETTVDVEENLKEIGGMTDSRIQSLKDAGYNTKESLSTATEEDLAEIKGIGSTLAGRIKEKYS